MDVTDRLQRLYALRDRITAEIARIEATTTRRVMAPRRPSPTQPAPPSASEVRTWARREGIPVSDQGRIRNEVREAYVDAHQHADRTS